MMIFNPFNFCVSIVKHYNLSTIKIQESHSLIKKNKWISLNIQEYCHLYQSRFEVHRPNKGKTFFP